MLLTPPLTRKFHYSTIALLLKLPSDRNFCKERETGKKKAKSNVGIRRNGETKIMKVRNRRRIMRKE